MISNLTRSAYNLTASLLENVKAIHIKALYRKEDAHKQLVEKRFSLAEKLADVAAAVYTGAEEEAARYGQRKRDNHAEIGRLLGDV